MPINKLSVCYKIGTSELGQTVLRRFFVTDRPVRRALFTFFKLSVLAFFLRLLTMTELWIVENGGPVAYWPKRKSGGGPVWNLSLVQ
jgi:hypothetical protein